MTSTQPLSLLFIFIGILLLVGSLLLYLRQRTFLARTIVAQGEVVELLPISQSGDYVVKRTESGIKLEKKYLFRPVLRFETQSGEAVEFTANLSMRPAAYRVGEQVELRYDPANPRQAVINRPLYLWFYVLLFVFFGLFLIGLGLLGYLLQQ